MPRYPGSGVCVLLMRVVMAFSTVRNSDRSGAPVTLSLGGRVPAANRLQAPRQTKIPSRGKRRIAVSPYEACRENGCESQSGRGNYCERVVQRKKGKNGKCATPRVI